MFHRYEQVFGDLGVSTELAELHQEFVVVPADMASTILCLFAKHIIITA